jgi:hypothetical protein
MTPEEFVKCFRREKDWLLEMYSDPASELSVASRLAQVGSSTSEPAAVRELLNIILTDVFYTVLLALDGSASLGGVQQPYKILDEEGHEVSSGDGTVETFAYEYFHGAKAGAYADTPQE